MYLNSRAERAGAAGGKNRRPTVIRGGKWGRAGKNTTHLDKGIGGERLGREEGGWVSGM